MKILIVNYEFPPVGGGASKASFNIARELVKLGHDIHVIMPCLLCRLSILC